MVKERRITIRLSENEYVKLKEETNREGVSVSDYLRNNLFSNRESNVTQIPYYKEHLDLKEIRTELLYLNYCIEKLTNIKMDKREYMKERIENIWLMLK